MVNDYLKFIAIVSLERGKYSRIVDLKIIIPSRYFPVSFHLLFLPVARIFNHDFSRYRIEILIE